MRLAMTFYQDALSHKCPYLDDQEAQNLYPDPAIPMNNKLYSQLIQFGFRRSGNSSYRPHCSQCSACIAVRIKVDDFILSRSQRRCLKRNKHLTTHAHPGIFNPEHYTLYRRYLNTRHANAGMDNPTQNSYRDFLFSFWSETELIEFRDQDRLIAVAVTDVITDGLSAFYTFFDPDYSATSPGTFAILAQIELARARELPHVYLGYWIKNCQKMRYKKNFSGLEGYINNDWRRL